MSNHIHFDGCPVVIADDDTACIHRINTPGTSAYLKIKFFATVQWLQMYIHGDW